MKAGRLLAGVAALGVAMLLAWPVTTPAQTETSQRERIARERAEVEAMSARQERECRDRFAVTACVEDARRTRRNDLAELRRQTNALDEAQRKQRAERRRQTIRDNQAQEEAQAKALAQKPAREPRTLPVQRPLATTAETGKTPRANSAKTPQARWQAPLGTPTPSSARANEAKNRASFEERQREAQAHRDEVTRRNEAQASQRKPAAPLPSPAASSP